ncbi:MAG: four helix bundle protein [Opitutaceae bacterium]|nr:four helix bundle protein [Opitutaceae bacterium]
MNQAELSERLWTFAARVGLVVDALPDTRLGRHVAGQLVRCGTSAAPNYDESGAAESRADFVHKLSIALKELRESRGWLRFAVTAKLLPAPKLADVIDESHQLCRILGKSLQTLRSPEDGKSELSDFRFQISDADSPAPHPLFRSLDHFAIIVPDTDAALLLWRDKFGFPLLYSEVVNNGTVRLTHLDLGNTHLQLVQPLTPDHPLQAWLARNGGAGLHHFCLRVDNVSVAQAESPVPATATPHQGTQGKRALFLEKSATHGVQVEFTGQ